MTVQDYVIRDTHGNIIQRSRNLAGIRRYVSKNPIKLLAIFGEDKASKNPDLYPGKLLILFADGASYEVNFASFYVLKGFVRRWRNVYGADLRVNSDLCGKVSSSNPALQQ
jgi:hypothetical protein